MTFDNTQEAMEGLQTSCCVTDISNWDRLHISGRDRLTFLHGQVCVCVVLITMAFSLRQLQRLSQQHSLLRIVCCTVYL